MYHILAILQFVRHFVSPCLIDYASPVEINFIFCPKLSAMFRVNPFGEPFHTFVAT